MTMMCDLPNDLVGEEILARVPITSLKAIRSTCKLWNALSKDFIVGSKATSRQSEFLGFTTISNKVCSLRFDLEGDCNHDGLVNPSTKQVGLLDRVEIYRVSHYDSLVLCVTNDKTKLLVWNPYLGQTKWIETPSKKNCAETNMYALGHNNNNNVPTYKILSIRGINGYYRVLDSEIYDSSSDSWSVVDLIPDFDMDRDQRGVTLNGRTYFFARARTNKKYTLGLGILLCFDYTKERFGQRQPLPVISDEEKTVVLSRVGEDQLAVLYEKWESKVLEIWVTNKIASDAVVSWSKFLKVDTRNIPMDYRTFLFHWDYGSFFIDEEKKVVVVFHDGLVGLSNLHATIAYILGEEGYINSLKIGYSLNVNKPIGICFPLVSSSYLPRV